MVRVHRGKREQQHRYRRQIDAEIASHRLQGGGQAAIAFFGQREKAHSQFPLAWKARPAPV